MKLIIDIPEEEYQNILHTGKASFCAVNAIEAGTPLEQTVQFAKWVATEIFDDMWEYNKDAFAEIACRKLAKLGIVREKSDEWELVEPQESEEPTGMSDAVLEHYKKLAEHYNGGAHEPIQDTDARD